MTLARAVVLLRPRYATVFLSKIITTTCLGVGINAIGCVGETEGTKPMIVPPAMLLEDYTAF